MILEFPDKEAVLGAFSYNSAYQNNYSVWGSRALVNVGRAYSISSEMKPIVELAKIENYKDIVQKIDVPAANQFELIFRDFCDTVLHKKARTGKINNIYLQLIAQARALEALRLSSKERRKVKLEEVK